MVAERTDGPIRSTCNASIRLFRTSSGDAGLVISLFLNQSSFSQSPIPFFNFLVAEFVFFAVAIFTRPPEFRDAEPSPAFRPTFVHPANARFSSCSRRPTA